MAAGSRRILSALSKGLLVLGDGKKMSVAMSGEVRR
jgi:hypothetical protein